MYAVILAGGKGTRLRPHTEDIPKALVPVGGMPIIEILLTQFNRVGVKSISIAVNHKAEKIEDVLGDGSRIGLKISYSREEKPLSTAGPLKLIADCPENFIVANGDILTDLDVSSMFKQHSKNEPILTVAVRRRSELMDYGVIHCDDKMIVESFDEKPTMELLVSMGIYCFSRRALDYIPDNVAFGFDQLMRRLIEEGERVEVYPFDGYWLDIGRPDDYQRAQDDIVRLRKEWGL